MPQRLTYYVAEVSSEDDLCKSTELLSINPETRGWKSSKYCIYPQHLILQLEQSAFVDKLQILVNNSAIPSKIDILLGEVPRGSNKTVKNAMFMEIGSIETESNKENHYKQRQLIAVQFSSSVNLSPVSYIKLVLHKNHTNKKNQYNQVTLVGVNVIGILPQESEEHFELDSVWTLYDELSFLAYTDQEVVQLIKKLEQKKMEASNTERFEYAKRLKEAIVELTEGGQALGSLQIEKQILADKEKYEEAKEKVDQATKLRQELYQSVDVVDLLDRSDGSRSSSRAH